MVKHKHTTTRHPLYWTWANIKKRCYYSKFRYYHLYGGRGIEVCERWRSSFSNFLSDVGERPAPGYSLDRINNNGHYEPGNIRWATPTMQSRNNRNAKLTIEMARLIREVHAEGTSQEKIARRFEISPKTVWNVIHRNNWKEA